MTDNDSRFLYGPRFVMHRDPMFDYDVSSPFLSGARYVMRKLALAGPLPDRGSRGDTFVEGVDAASEMLARCHPSEATRVLSERDAIRTALKPDQRPRPGHRFDAPAREYTLVIAGVSRTIPIVD